MELAKADDVIREARELRAVAQHVREESFRACGRAWAIVSAWRAPGELRQGGVETFLRRLQ